MALRLTYTAILLLSAAPAAAKGAVQVSESSNITLFALGVAGVLLGRRLAKRGKDED